MRFWRDKILHRLIACDSKPERFTTLPVSCVPTNPARNAANQTRNAKFRKYVLRRKTALCSKYGVALGSAANANAFSIACPTRESPKQPPSASAFRFIQEILCHPSALLRSPPFQPLPPQDANPHAPPKLHAPSLKLAKPAKSITLPINFPQTQKIQKSTII